MSASDLLAEEAKNQNSCSGNGQTSPLGHKDLPATNSMRRSWSADSLTSNGVKTCVCAPTTHAGSFRCRLHRLAAHAANAQASAPLPPPSAPSRQSTSSRTVEAQF
eukprot:Gb_31432 [translate_table: standard]